MHSVRDLHGIKENSLFSWVDRICCVANGHSLATHATLTPMVHETSERKTKQQHRLQAVL